MKDLNLSMKKSHDIVFVVLWLLALAAAGFVMGFEAECCRFLGICIPAQESRQGLYFLFLTSLLLLFLTFRRWKKAELAREEMEEILSSINPDVLMVVMPDCTIEDCTRHVANMFGYAAREVIGGKTWMLYEDRRASPEGENEIYEALERDGFHVGEATGIRRNGSRFSLEIITGKMENRPGSVLLLRDITSRKRAEQERAKMEEWFRQGQKMEALGALAGGIAHDFNGVLSVIRLATELLDLKTQETQALRSTIKHIQEAVERGATLVKQIRTISGRETSDQGPVHVSLVAQEALEFVSASLPATIEVRKHLDMQADMVMGNADQLFRVFVNLCANAVYAMQPNGGILDVRVEERALQRKERFWQGELRPGPYVRIVVADTGFGIEKEVMDRIFDPFFSTKPPEVGSGVGLSIVYGIVRNLRGGIRVTSEEGKGTTFEILLPCFFAGSESREKQHAGLRDPNRGRRRSYT